MKDVGNLIHELNKISPLSISSHTQPDSLMFFDARHNINIAILTSSHEVCFNYFYYNDEDYSEYTCSYDEAVDQFKQCIVNTQPPVVSDFKQLQSKVIEIYRKHNPHDVLMLQEFLLNDEIVLDVLLELLEREKIQDDLARLISQYEI